MGFFFGWFVFNIILIWAARRPLRKALIQANQNIEILQEENAFLRGQYQPIPQGEHKHLHIHGNNDLNYLTKKHLS